jgi:hypothetical protein
LTTANIPAGSTYYSVYGISYKFTYENYSNPFPNDNETGRSYKDIVEYPASNTSGAIKIGGSIQCDHSFKQKYYYASTTLPTFAPKIITTSYYMRPSESAIIHCANSPFDSGDDNVFHSTGEEIVYLDGHAKFVLSEAYANVGCDGPDWAWDMPGSCNTQGYQRADD